MTCAGEMYQLVEARKQHLEKYVKQMRLLFKPWPPPQADIKETARPQDKIGAAPETTSSSPCSVTAEEEEGVSLVDKLLQKAQKARDVQKKLEDSNKSRVKKDTKANVEDASNTTESTGTNPCKLTDNSGGKHAQNNTDSKKGLDKGRQKQSTVDKKCDSRSSVSSQGSLRNSGTASKRPGSSNSRKTVQSTAPFKTDVRQASARHQTTYRATIAKTGAKLQAGSAKSGKRGTIPPPTGSASTVRRRCPQQEVEQNNHRDTQEDDTEQTESERLGDIPQEHCDSSRAEDNCDRSDRDNRLTDAEHRMAALNLSKSAKDSSDGDKQDDAGAGDSAMFQLDKDGTSLTMPSAFRKAVHTNRKLRQKVYAQHVTQKVNSPQKSQQFLDGLNNAFSEPEAAQTHNQAQLLQQLVTVYDHLHALLDSLTLHCITESSSPGMVVRAKKLLEYILTKFHETEQLLRMCDLRLVNAVDSQCSSLRHKVPQPYDHCRSVWYPNHCSFLGTDRAVTYRYRSCKQLEGYVTQVYTAQLRQLQLDLMDDTAKLILPLLQSLDPTSSDFLHVLRCGYSLLSSNPGNTPVVVRDSIQDTSVMEEDYDPS